MRKLDSLSQDNAGADHILSFFRRLRLDWLLLHFPPRLVRSVYVFVNGFVTIGVLALLALVSRNPFVFPSLGPYRVSPVLLPPRQDLKSTKHHFRPRYRACLRLWGVRCHRCWSTAVRRTPRYLLAENPGSGSFAFGDWRIHGSPRC
jgi:hypothetical protein